MPSTYGEDEGLSNSGKSAATAKRLSKAEERKRAFLEKKAAASSGGARVAPPIVLAPVSNSDFWNDVSEEQKPSAKPVSFTNSGFGGGVGKTEDASLSSAGHSSPPLRSNFVSSSSSFGPNSPALHSFPPPSANSSSNVGHNSPQVRSFGSSPLAPAAAAFQLPPQSFNRFGTPPSSSHLATSPPTSHSFGGMTESGFTSIGGGGGWGEDLGDIGLDASLDNGTPQRVAPLSSARATPPQMSLIGATVASPPLGMGGWGDDSIALPSMENDHYGMSFTPSAIDENGLSSSSSSNNNNNNIVNENGHSNDSEFGFDVEGRPVSNPGMLFVPRRTSFSQPLPVSSGNEEVGIVLPSPLPSPVEQPPSRRMSLSNLGFGNLLSAVTPSSNTDEREGGLRFPLEDAGSNGIEQPFFPSGNSSAATFHLSSYASPHTERRPSAPHLFQEPSFPPTATTTNVVDEDVGRTSHPVASVDDRGQLIEDVPFSGVAVDEEGGAFPHHDQPNGESNVKSIMPFEDTNSFPVHSTSVNHTSESLSSPLHNATHEDRASFNGATNEDSKEHSDGFLERKAEDEAVVEPVAQGHEPDVDVPVEFPKESTTVRLVRNEAQATSIDASSEPEHSSEDLSSSASSLSSTTATTTATPTEPTTLTVTTAEATTDDKQQQQQTSNNNNNDEVLSTNTNSTGVLVSPSRSRGWEDDLPNPDLMSGSEQLEADGVLVPSAAELSAAQRELLGGWGDDDISEPSLPDHPEQSVASGWGNDMDFPLSEPVNNSQEISAVSQHASNEQSEPQIEANSFTPEEVSLATHQESTATTTATTAPPQFVDNADNASASSSVVAADDADADASSSGSTSTVAPISQDSETSAQLLNDDGDVIPSAKGDELEADNSAIRATAESEQTEPVEMVEKKHDDNKEASVTKPVSALSYFDNEDKNDQNSNAIQSSDSVQEKGSDSVQDSAAASELSAAQQALLGGWDDDLPDVPAQEDTSAPAANSGWGGDDFPIVEAATVPETVADLVPAADPITEQEHPVASDDRRPSFIAFEAPSQVEEHKPLASSPSLFPVPANEETDVFSSSAATASANSEESAQPDRKVSESKQKAEDAEAVDNTTPVRPLHARRRSYFDEDEQGGEISGVAPEHVPAVAISSPLSYFDEPSPAAHTHTEAIPSAVTAAAPELTPEQQALLGWDDDLDLVEDAAQEENGQSEKAQPNLTNSQSASSLITSVSSSEREASKPRSLSEDYFGTSSSPATTTTTTSTTTTASDAVVAPVTAAAVHTEEDRPKASEENGSNGWGDELDLPSFEDQAVLNAPPASAATSITTEDSNTPLANSFAHVVPRTPEKSSTLDKYFSLNPTKPTSAPASPEVKAISSSSPVSLPAVSEPEENKDVSAKSVQEDKGPTNPSQASGWDDDLGLPTFEEAADVTATKPGVSNIATTTESTSAVSPAAITNDAPSNTQSDVAPQQSGWDEGLDLPSFDESTISRDTNSATTSAAPDVTATSSVVTSSSSSDVTPQTSASGWDADLGFDETPSEANLEVAPATTAAATSTTSTTSDAKSGTTAPTATPAQQSNGWDDDLPSFDELDQSHVSKTPIKITQSADSGKSDSEVKIPAAIAATTPKSSPYDYFAAEPPKSRAVASTTQGQQTPTVPIASASSSSSLTTSTAPSATSNAVAQDSTSSSTPVIPSHTQTKQSGWDDELPFSEEPMPKTTATANKQSGWDDELPMSDEHTQTSAPTVVPSSQDQSKQSGWDDDLPFSDEPSQTTTNTTTVTTSGTVASATRSASPLASDTVSTSTGATATTTAAQASSAVESSPAPVQVKPSPYDYFAAEPKARAVTPATSQSVSSTSSSETPPSSSTVTTTASSTTAPAPAPANLATTAVAPSATVVAVSSPAIVTSTAAAAPTTTNTSTASTITPHITLPTVTTTATPFTPTFYSFTPTPSGMFTPSINRLNSSSSIAVSPSTPPALLIEEINRLKFDLEQANTQVFKAKCAVKLLNRTKQDNVTQIADLQRQLAGQGVSVTPSGGGSGSSEATAATAAAAAAATTASQKFSELEKELKSNLLLLTQKTDQAQELQHSLEGQTMLLTQKQTLIENLTRENTNIKQQLVEAREKQPQNASAIEKMTENFKKAKALAQKFKDQFSLKETELTKLQEHIKSLTPSLSLSQEMLEQKTQLELAREEIERRKIRERETYVALEEMKERVREMQEKQDKKEKQHASLTASAVSILTLSPSSSAAAAALAQQQQQQPKEAVIVEEKKCEQCERNNNLAQELAQREEDLSAHHSELEELRKELKQREAALLARETSLSSSSSSSASSYENNNNNENGSRERELNEQILSYETTIQTLKENAQTIQTEQSMQIEAQTNLITQLKEIVRKQDEEIRNNKNDNGNSDMSEQRNKGEKEKASECTECVRLQNLLAVEQSTLDDIRKTLEEEREGHAREILDMSSSLESTHKQQIQILQHQLSSLQNEQMLSLQRQRQQEEEEKERQQERQVEEEKEKAKEVVAAAVEKRECVECIQLKAEKEELEAKIHALSSSPPLSAASSSPSLSPCENCVSLQQQLDVERENLLKEQEAHRVTMNKLNEAKKESNNNKQQQQISITTTTPTTTPTQQQQQQQSSRREGRLEERILMLREGIKERDTFIKIQGNHLKNIETEIKAIREEKEELKLQLANEEKKNNKNSNSGSSGGLFGFLKKKKEIDPNAYPGPGHTWNGRAWVKEEEGGGGGGGGKTKIPPLPPLPAEVVLPPSPSLSPSDSADGISSSSSSTSRNSLPRLSLGGGGRNISDPPLSTNRFMQKHAATPQSRYLNTFDAFGGSSSSDSSSSGGGDTSNSSSSSNSLSIDPNLAAFLSPLDSLSSCNASSSSSSTSSLVTPRGRTKLPSRNKLLAAAAERKLELVKEESSSKLEENDQPSSSSSQQQHSQQEVEEMKKKLASYEENEMSLLLPGGAVGEDKSLLDTIRQLRNKNAEITKELQTATTKLRQLEQQSESLAKNTASSGGSSSSSSGSVSQQEFLAMKMNAQKQMTQLNTEITTLNSKLKNAQTHRDELLEELKKYTNSSSTTAAITDNKNNDEGVRASSNVDAQEQIEALKQKSSEEEMRKAFAASQITQQNLQQEIIQLKNALEVSQKQIDSLQQQQQQGGGDLISNGVGEEEEDEKDSKNGGGAKLAQRKLVRLTKQLAQATARIKQLESEPPKHAATAVLPSSSSFVPSSSSSVPAVGVTNFPVRRFPPPSSSAANPLSVPTEDEKKPSNTSLQLIPNVLAKTAEATTILSRESASFLASLLRENEQLRRLVVKLTRKLARVNQSSDNTVSPASIQSSRRLVRSLSTPNLEVALWASNLSRNVERLTGGLAGGTLARSGETPRVVRRSGCRIFSRLLFSWFFTALIAILLTEVGNL